MNILERNIGKFHIIAGDYFHNFSLTLDEKRGYDFFRTLDIAKNGAGNNIQRVQGHIYTHLFDEILITLVTYLGNNILHTTLLCDESQKQIFFVKSRSGNEGIHFVEIFIFQKGCIRSIAVKNHYVIQMCGKVITAFFTLFNELNRNTEFSQLSGQIKSCFSSADDHDLLKVSVLSLFVNFFMKLHDFGFFTNHIDSVAVFNDSLPVRNDNLAVSGNCHYQHVGENFADFNH